LAYLDESHLALTATPQSQLSETISLVVGPVEVFLPQAGILDLEGERARIEKELGDAEAQIDRLEKLLASAFAQKAPPAVVDKERERLEGFRDVAEKLRRQLNSL
jgi:valyl-tRNA synthetase